jgi:hypothetical protein
VAEQLLQARHGNQLLGTVKVRLTLGLKIHDTRKKLKDEL